MTRYLLTALLGLLLLKLLLTPANQGSGSQARAKLDQTGALEGGTGAVVAKPAEPRSATTPVREFSMPPRGAALAGHFAELAKRARAGDAAAATRLFHDVSRCRRHLSGQAVSPQAARNDAEQLRNLKQQLWNCDAAQVCAGIPTTVLEHPQQWAMLAAEAGDPVARVWIATGSFLQQTDIRALELVPRFRAVAHDWLTEGVRRGSPIALMYLTEAYLSPPGARGWFEGVIPYDPVLGLAWLQLQVSMVPPEAEAMFRQESRIASLRARLGAAELARVELLQQQLRKQLPTRFQSIDEYPHWTGFGLTSQRQEELVPACLDSVEQQRWQQLQSAAGSRKARP